MREAVPQPERENPPFERLFNVDAMSNDQIVALSRGLLSGPEHSKEDAEVRAAEYLFYQVALSVRDLAAREPERVKDLVHSCEQSSNDCDHQLAGITVQALIDYDYAFTRDTLVSLYLGEACARNPNNISGTAFDLAGHQIGIVMRDNLTPAQIADFNARIAATHMYEEGFQVEPAWPGETDFC